MNRKSKGFKPKPHPVPKMRVKPMNPDGAYAIDFSVPMMAPDGEINSNIYDAAFGFNVASLNTDDNVEGTFGESKRDRKLRSAGDCGASTNKLNFSPVVEEHTSAGIKIKIIFDCP